MEKENNICAEEKDCGCADKKECSCVNKCLCCFKKCCKIRKVLWLILIVLVFSLGIQIGEIKSSRFNNDGCRMINWRYKNIKDFKTDDGIKTPDVSKQIAPEVKQ